MLTTARQASEYRAVASAVKSWLVDLQLSEAHPIDELTRGRIGTVQEMLAVGQFSNGQGELDTYMSTPDKLDLAKDLVTYVPPAVKASPNFTMRDWAGHALQVLEAVKNGADWADLEADHAFIEDELVPLLRSVASLPPEEPKW
jgi:hypothetical protein